MLQKSILSSTDAEQYRPQLEGYAYHILGSYEDAQDVVQDVFLKQLESPTPNIEDTRNYLIKSVVNASINLKKRKSKFIKDYPGEWLPEPVSSEKPDQNIELSETLNYSLMVLMEQLKPKERATFILKEAYNYSHEKIAELLDTTVENSRQLLKRAKNAIKILPTGNKAIANDLLQDYLSAIQNGDMEKLEGLLKEGITATSDGGGKAIATRKILAGKEIVLKFLLGLSRKSYWSYRFQIQLVNDAPAILYYEGSKLVTCQVFEIEDNQVKRLYFIRNPDKLKFL